MIFFIPGYLFIVFILVALSGGYIFLNSFFETIPTVMFWGTIILCSIFWIGETKRKSHLFYIGYIGNFKLYIYI